MKMPKLRFWLFYEILVYIRLFQFDLYHLFLCVCASDFGLNSAIFGLLLLIALMMPLCSLEHLQYPQTDIAVIVYGGKKYVMNSEFKLMFLNRTACEGTCPVYKLKILPSGKVDYGTGRQVK